MILRRYILGQTDAFGNVTNLEYDDFDRLKKIQHPLPSPGASPRLEEIFTYDKLGNIKTKVDTAGRTTSYDYDTASRLTKIADALSNETQFTYNARSQMTKVKDALNQEYDFTYNHVGRVLSQTRAGSTMSFGYDAVGNRTSRTAYNGNATTYTYDNLNRLTNIAYTGSTDYATYGYDDLSRLSSAANQNGTVAMTYDNRGRLKTETDVFASAIEYVYDAAGNRTQLKIGGTNYTTYAYDLANRLTTLTAADLTQIGFAYDNADRMTSRTYPNGVTTTYEYDGMSRLKRLKDTTLTSTLFDRQYTYNTANQISQIVEPSLTRNFAYDNIDRLTTVTNPTATSESYTFDAVGNRTASHLSSSYSYSGFNKLTATSSAGYTYNTNGAMTGKTVGATSWAYDLDHEDKLTQATKSSGEIVRYKFDALGRRISRQTEIPSPSPLPPTIETTNFVHDGLDVVQDKTGLLTTNYLNGFGIDSKLRLSTGVNTDYFLADHLGSTNGLANAAGVVTQSNSYDSFGNPSNPGLPSRYQFTGREFDSFTGLQYSRARWYDPNLGRFTAEDPVGFEGGDVNLYAYVQNDPTSASDPTGLFPHTYPFWAASVPWNNGGDFADSWDKKIDGPAGFWNPSVAWNPIHGPIRLWDIPRGFGDLFRVGQGLGQAVYCADNWYGKAAFIAMDIGRGAGLFAAMAGPFGGIRAAGTRGQGTEFSHWVPRRMGGPRSIFNGNYVSIQQHALSDPFRYRFMPRPWKAVNPMPNTATQQWNRVPQIYKGSGAGIGAGSTPKVNGGCGCE